MIDFASEFAAVWGQHLWCASWQGGIFLAVAWAIARWCTFLSPRVVCWVWRLACVKLLVALVWVSPIAIAVLPPAPPIAQPPVKVAHAQPMLPDELIPLDNDELSESKSQLPASAESQTPATIARAPISFSTVLLPVWLAGVLYCVYRSAGQWQAARRLVQTSRDCASDSLLRLYQAEACRIGVRRLPRLRLSPEADGPILIGVWRPAIILPAECERTFAEFELRLMLAHELAHHQRKDLAWNWLPTAATWLFYFHPLVWLMTRCWSEAQEAACDETLLQRNVAPPAEYGRLLLKLAALSPTKSPASLATVGVLGAYRNLERRILTMTRVRPFSARRFTLAAVAALSIGVCGVVPWRLVAQEPRPATPKADPKPEGKAEQKPNESSETKSDTNDPAAAKALARLKELGAQPATAKQIGIQSGWRGTDTDLKFINALPELKWLFVELERVTPAGLAEIIRMPPIETLILHGLSDANLEKLPRLPACQRLMLVNYELTTAGFALLAKRAAGLEYLDLSGGPATDEIGNAKFPLTDAGLAQISLMASLKGLSLYQSNITDDGLSQLAALKSLAELTVSTCPQVHGRGYANLAAVKSLRRLTIFSQPIAGEELRGLAKLVQLESLMLNPANLLPANIEAADVAELARLTNLQTLDLRTWDWNVKSFGNELLRATSQIKPLRELWLYSVSADADGIDSLASAGGLRELILKIEFNERNVAALARLKNLQKLGLEGRGAVPEEVLAQLAQLTSLAALSIDGSEIDDRGLAQFKNLTALERLNLPDSKITGAGLASLDKLTKLNTLTLTNSPLDDAGSQHLRLLPALQYLNLGKTKITDESIGAIGALKNLQMLTIDGDAITARGLTQLKDLKRLSYISAEGLAGTQDEIATMRAALKEVHVSTEPRPAGMTGTAVFVRTREAD